MDRLYKALAWLAVVSIILGLVFSYLYARMTASQFPQGFSSGSSDGLFGAFFSVLKFQAIFLLLSLSNLLEGGAIILAMALAWVTRRHAWLTALIVVTLLSFVGPTFLTTWQNLHIASSQAQSQAQVDVYNVVSTAVSLLPVGLALIFALINRKAAAANTADAASAADADLGLVRSAL